MENKSFFRTHKALAFLPLLLMGAGVWYYVKGLVSHDRHAPPSVPAAEEPAVFSSPSKPPPGALPEPYDPKAGLDIQGPPEFQSQVTHALKLIWMADRETFLFIRRNLSVIRSENRTGFYYEPGKVAASISTDHAFKSLTWCAGVIAHQAWHGWFELNSRRKARKAPPPPGVTDNSRPEANPLKVDYKGLDAILDTEDRAFALQLEVLRKVGAPASEINRVLRRAPRDFTAGHDGSYSLNP